MVLVFERLSRDRILQNFALLALDWQVIDGCVEAWEVIE